MNGLLGRLYDRHVLPTLIDCACGTAAVMQARAAVVPRARGRVLEIGIGTGRNLPLYDPARIESITGIDPAAQMQPRARRRAAAAGLRVELLHADAEHIDADAQRFDCVVVTFTLCTIPDPVAALREMRRMLKPGGELLFCEHGRAPDAQVRRWQTRLTPYWKPLAGGCHLDRDIPALIEAGGLRLRELEARYLRGPRPMTYVYSGVAVPD